MRKTIATFAVPLVGATLLMGLAACDADTGTGNTASGGTGMLNDADEAKDVVNVKRRDQKYLGTSAIVTVKNSSAKASDYMIEVNAESKDGKKQYDTADVFIQNVKPGQQASGDGMFLKNIPVDAVIEVGSLDRSESL